MHCAPSNHIQEQFNLISPFVMHIKPSRSSSIVCVWDHSHVLLVITKQRNTYSWVGLSYTLFFVYFILFRKLPELSSGFIVHAYPGGPYSSLFPPLTSFTSQPHAHFSCSLSFFCYCCFLVSLLLRETGRMSDFYEPVSSRKEGSVPLGFRTVKHKSGQPGWWIYTAAPIKQLKNVLH